MNFTKRQLTLLQMSLTMFYDEISKDGPNKAKPEFKSEVMEIAQMIQNAYEDAE